MLVWTGRHGALPEGVCRTLLDLVGILAAAAAESQDDFFLSRVDVVAEAKLSNPEAVLAAAMAHVLELPDVVALGVVGGVALEDAPHSVASRREFTVSFRQPTSYSFEA